MNNKESKANFLDLINSPSFNVDYDVETSLVDEGLKISDDKSKQLINVKQEK